MCLCHETELIRSTGNAQDTHKSPEVEQRHVIAAEWMSSFFSQLDPAGPEPIKTRPENVDRVHGANLATRAVVRILQRPAIQFNSVR